MDTLKSRTQITLPHLYTPRPYQLNFLEALDNGTKRAVWCLHRRAGKDFTTWQWLIKTLIQKKQIAYYILPTYSQAKKIVWEGITKEGIKFLDCIPREIISRQSESELSITFTNGSHLQLVGSENYDRLVGTNPQICIFSEMAIQNPTAWEYLRPILAENNGVAIFISTPRGRNHFHNLYNIAKNNDEWFCEILTIDDTGAISKEAIAKERASGMSEEMIEQEFYCSFEVGQLGSFYGRSIKKAEEEYRIGIVSYDKNLLVYTAWDIGFSDSTSIIFFQQRGQEILVIDHYENHGYAVQHYIDILREKNYNYATHFLPHDGKSHSMAGTSFIQVARESGYYFDIIPNTVPLMEGIEKVRGIFHRVFIDSEKCSYLIKCLLQYHSEWDDNSKVFRDRPKHDWSSHSCFVGETLITTAYGNERIDKIKKGDLVLTPNGYRKVLNVFKKRTNALRKLTTTNNFIICTPSHRVYSEKGLVRADALCYDNLVFNRTFAREWENINTSNVKIGSLGFRGTFLLAKMSQWLFLMDIIIDGKNPITEEELQHLMSMDTYIEQFGHTVRERFWNLMLYIIKMGIPKTIVFLIWKCFLQKSTARHMIRKKEEQPHADQFIKQWNMLKNGILANREYSGIESMLKNLILESFQYPPHVLFVEEAIMQKSIIKSFAQMDANKRVEIDQVLTMKEEFALTARNLLNAISINSQEAVVKNVVVNTTQETEVYDLEVEKDHCYFANNILVSNCDAFRYLVLALERLSGPSITMTKERLHDLRRDAGILT